MVDENIALVAQQLKAAGLDGGVKGSGLEYLVEASDKTHDPKQFKLDHKLLSRPYLAAALRERVAAIVEDYQAGNAKQCE